MSIIRLKPGFYKAFFNWVTKYYQFCLTSVFDFSTNFCHPIHQLDAKLKPTLNSLLTGLDISFGASLKNSTSDTSSISSSFDLITFKEREIYSV